MARFGLPAPDSTGRVAIRAPLRSLAVKTAYLDGELCRAICLFSEIRQKEGLRAAFKWRRDQFTQYED